MNNPSIVINGKMYTPAKPKAGIWRELMEFDARRKDIVTTDFLDEHARIIAKVFSIPEVTPAIIIESLAIQDIIPLYLECFSWICYLLNSKLDELPKQKTPVQE